MITRRIFLTCGIFVPAFAELVAKDDCPIRGGHPRLPRIGRHRGRTNPRISKAGRERAKPARRSAARRLVSLGSLSVPGLQAWGPGPDRLRRGNRARTGAHPGRGNPPAGNRLERASGGAGRRDCGYRGRRDQEQSRSAFAYFSKPYRSETDVLILPKGAAGRYAFSTIDEMLETFAKQKFRLGVVAGFVYADSRVNAFIADPTFKDLIVPHRE
jgi:hypothetical protein